MSPVTPSGGRAQAAPAAVATIRLRRWSSAHLQLFVPGNTDQSLLMDVLLKRNGVQMPLTGPLPADRVKTIESWIAQGAPDNWRSVCRGRAEVTGK